jgi:HK97 family phage major capsid protein
MNEDELKALEALKTQIEGFKKELKEATEQKGLEDLAEKITALEKNITTLTEKDVDKTILEINQNILKFREQIIELREEQNKSKESGEGSKKKDFVSTKEIEEFINATFVDGKKTRDHAHMTVKAPEIFGIPQTFVSGADMSAFTGREIDPTLYQRKRKRNLILDNFTISSITVPELLYLEKIEVGDTNPTSGDPGGADWIASGAQKPMRSFRVTTGKVEAKKIAIFGTIEDKLLKDVPSFDSWIREDFLQEMREVYNAGLLNNNPAVNAEAPLGMKQNAITFAPTPAFDETISNPNYIDAIVASAAYMDSLKEEAGKVFVAGDVWYAIHILKDTDDKYKNNNLVYTNSLGQLFIAGVEVIKSDAEDIPSTHLLMVSIDPGFKIRNYGDAVIERGLNEADFRYDRTSYRGYQEVLSYVPSHRENSVLYDTWANIQTAISLPVV